MNRSSAISRMLVFGGLCAVGLLLARVALHAETNRPALGDRGARGGPDPMIGKAAPDFELPLLKEQTNAKGEKVNRITDEKVKLSSLFGKKTVVLFMSSYT